jgi:hypothetical protein
MAGTHHRLKGYAIQGLLVLVIAGLGFVGTLLVYMSLAPDVCG